LVFHCPFTLPFRSCVFVGIPVAEEHFIIEEGFVTVGDFLIFSEFGESVSTRARLKSRVSAGGPATIDF